MYTYFFAGITSHWLKFLNPLTSGWMNASTRVRKAMGTCSWKAEQELSPSVTLYRKIHS